jgi:AraC family transcriptional regulator
MSLEKNLTQELWRRFMPERNRISNRVGTDLFSMQVYDKKPDFNHFDPTSEFTKWATIEVRDHLHIPEGLHPYILCEGLYAVFIHTGIPQQFSKTFNSIFDQWFPVSGYELDHREHFERLPKDYSPVDPSAREEMWGTC